MRKIRDNKNKTSQKSKMSYHSYKTQVQKSNLKKGKNTSKKVKTQKEIKKEKKENLKKDIKQKNKVLKKARRENLKKSIVKNLNSDNFIIVAGGIIIILLLSLITFKQSQIADIKYSINKKNTEIHNINNEIKVEKLKIDESSRSDIIEQKAMEELGMIYRRQDQIEYITVD
ncbi:hypothetical protein [Peptoanaerobacter stomatis]|jgi:hypothetical protein|uniref:hypothetical protein n=1 Tax=Peptoanaerobacter stomatis TaxID=796937 RepID=UPI003F9F7FCD